MSQTYEVGIRLAADSAGFVAQSKASAESLDKVAESTRKVADASRAARDEVMKSKEADAARRFESSQVRKQLEETNVAQAASNVEAQKFVARLKEQADALGKTKIQIEQYKAAQLDLNTQQKASVKASLEQMEAHDKNASTIKELARLSLAAGAAAGAYVVSTALQVKAVIDQADGFNKLSQSMGVSTKFLSAYTYQGQLAGVSQQEMAVSARLLAKNVTEASTGTGLGAKLFTALGISVVDANGKIKSLEELLPQIANRFASFEDGAAKSTIAVQMLGRAGERMIPLLNGGAAGFERAAKEAAEMRRVIGPEFAKNAETFNDNLTRMSAALTASKYAIAEDALPWLVKYTNQLVLAAQASGNNLLRGGFIAATTSTTNIDAEIKRLEAQQKQEDAAAAFGSNVPVLGRIVAPVLGMQQSETIDKLAFLRRLRDKQFDDQMAAQVAQQRAMLGAQAPAVPSGSGRSGGSQSETISDYERLIKVINEKNAVQSVEESIGGKLTLAQRDALKIMTDLRDGTITLTDIEKQNITAVLEGTLASEKANLARERYTKQTEEAVRTHAKWLVAEEQATVKLELQNRKLAEHNQTIGLSSEQLRALTVTRAEEALAIAQQAEQMAALDPLFEGDIDMMRRRTEAAREFLDLTRDGAARWAWAEQTKRMTEANDRMRDNLERGLTDSIVRGFDKGKPFAQNFLDSLETMFKSAILTPIIQPLVRPVAGAITGAIGSIFPGTAGAGGGDPFSLASAGSSISGLFGGPTIGGAVSSLFAPSIAGYGGAAGTAAALGELGGIAGAAGAGASGGLMAGLGTAMPYVGAALLAAQVLGVFDSGNGPKPSELGILGSPGQFWVSQNNVPGGEGNLALYNTLNARLNDPKQFDQAILAQHVGYLQGQPGEDANSMFQKLTASIAPAAQAAQDQLNTQKALLAKQDELKAALGSIGPQLAEKLGIGTLQAAQNALATSEYNAPLERFSAAKAQLNATYGSAIGGDLTAVQSFPQVLQSALSIGRDVYASGPEFADFFKTSNRMLQDLLDHQKEVQTDILRDLPAVIAQSSLDQVSEIRNLKASLERGLANISAELRQLNAA